MREITSSETPVAETSTITTGHRLPAVIKKRRERLFKPADKIEKVLKWTPGDYRSGRFRIMLYRFLTDHIPLINSCVSTWVRLTSAPGRYKIIGGKNGEIEEKALRRLESLYKRIYCNALGNRVGIVNLLPILFSGLFRDGLFGGFLTVMRDYSGSAAFSGTACSAAF